MAKNKKPRPKPAKSPDVPTTDAGPLKSNPFGALAGLSAPEAPAAASENAPSPKEPPADESPDKPSRVILSYQRKGRGGKEVTLIELRGAADSSLADWLSRLKKALGCGGFVESQRLVVTGDQRQRLKSFFESQGIDRITVG